MKTVKSALLLPAVAVVLIWAFPADAQRYSDPRRVYDDRYGYRYYDRYRPYRRPQVYGWRDDRRPVADYDPGRFTYDEYPEWAAKAFEPPATR